MVAAMVTVRPELEKLVAFSEPTRTNVNVVVVTGPYVSNIYEYYITYQLITDQQDRLAAVKAEAAKTQLITERTSPL